jgi:hypothetical protein
MTAAPNQEHLPFKVAIANESQLAAAARVRAAAYGRHVPEFASKLETPEAADFEEGALVIVATRNLDGETLGSLRVHDSAAAPLPVEKSFPLPRAYEGTRILEATRMNVAKSPTQSLVRDALFKAFYQFAMAREADWMLATARSPVDRIYEGLFFKDIAEPGRFEPMAHVGGMPHRILVLSPAAVRPSWIAANHPLRAFFFETDHPGLEGARPERATPRFPSEALQHQEPAAQRSAS